MRNYRLANRRKIQRSKLASYRSAEEILLGSFDVCRAKLLTKAVVGVVVCRGTCLEGVIVKGSKYRYLKSCFCETKKAGSNACKVKAAFHQRRTGWGKWKILAGISPMISRASGILCILQKARPRVTLRADNYGWETPPS
jgi:hypothetical protein